MGDIHWLPGSSHNAIADYLNRNANGNPAQLSKSIKGSYDDSFDDSGEHKIHLTPASDGFNFIVYKKRIDDSAIELLGTLKQLNPVEEAARSDVRDQAMEIRKAIWNALDHPQGTNDRVIAQQVSDEKIFSKLGVDQNIFDQILEEVLNRNCPFGLVIHESFLYFLHTFCTTLFKEGERFIYESVYEKVKLKYKNRVIRKICQKFRK